MSRISTDKIVRTKNNKGNYPYTWNNDIVIAQLRGCDLALIIIQLLSPEATPISQLDVMRDQIISVIFTLIQRHTELSNEFYNKKRKMSLDNFLEKRMGKSDFIKVSNYLRMQQETIEKDLERLESNGMSYKPITDIGRTIKLLEILKKLHYKEMNEKSLEIYLRLMEDCFIETINGNPKLKADYSRHLNWMNGYAKKQDLIKYQLVTKHESLPPLNSVGFTALDEWQKRAIDLMRERKSAILSIPTSGGKTYLSAYLTKSVGRIWFIAPSIPLARQVSAYLTRVSGIVVPYITDIYRPKLEHDDMLELINSSKIIVSTPNIFLDYLPEINPLTKDDNLIIDEIHMMGSHEGDSMEAIALMNKNALLLGLSATVSNPDDLISWRRNVGGDDLTIVSSNKRFFNLQTAFWNSETKSVQNINPLSMVSMDDIISGDILRKDLKPTPPDVYDLGKKIEEKFGEELADLRMVLYFKHLKTRRGSLSEVLEYFNLLLKFLVEKSETDIEKVSLIINSFKPVDLVEETTNLFDIISHLDETNNTPVLIFERNTYTLMRIARKLIKEIDETENLAYPERFKEIEKKRKDAKRRHKEMEKAGLFKDGLNEKVLDKMAKSSGLDEIVVEHFQRPQDGFRWSKSISQTEIEDIESKLRKFFPREGDFFHPIIHALWRGIGIYAVGLPDEYLILVQVMANNKQLGVVLSDKSMTFGVSMPFRNVVIYRDPTTKDELNPLLFKQMEGRAGRRGQDRKGTVIFAGYSWDRIKELSVSEIPKIEGQESIENVYLPIGARLAELSDKSYNFESVLNSNLYKMQNSIEESSWDELKELWLEWTPEAFNDKEMLRMLWQTRNYGCDGVSFYHVVNILDRIFSRGDIGENKQIEAALILSYFLQTRRAKYASHILIKPENYDTLFQKVRSNLCGMGIPLVDEDLLDNRVWISVRNNKLEVGRDDEECQEIRENFYKFASILRIVQNYCYYSKRVTLAKILGKLFTRCKWILWGSSPLINFNKDPVYKSCFDEEIPDSDDSDCDDSDCDDSDSD